MNIYGELTRAQIENLTSDPTLAAASTGRLWMRTDLSTVKIDLGGSTDTFVFLAATQSLTNKTLSDALTCAQIATPSNPASGKNKFYFKSDNQPYVLNSSGTEAKLLTTTNSLIVPTVQKFLLGTYYTFTVTAANATLAATYTNNGQTFTVVYTIAGGTSLVCSATGAPAASGTLTKSAGTGDSTITFSAQVANGTYVLPSTAPIYIRVRLVGGGGGGAGSGTGAGTAATDGTASTFGTALLSAGGGTHGVINVNGGAGGTSSLGTGPIGIALTGATGGPGVGQGTVPTSSIPGGSGGNSALGGGGSGGSSGIGTGAAGAANTGGGGGGGVAGTTTNVQSGAGGGAGGFVDAIITSPSASYPFTIGNGGTAGGAGTSGFAGAAGGLGMLLVEEFYQ